MPSEVRKLAFIVSFFFFFLVVVSVGSNAVHRNFQDLIFPIRLCIYITGVVAFIIFCAASLDLIMVKLKDKK